MILNIDNSQLEGLMQSFYTLSGIRLVLFDTEFHEILSYPKHDCEFCRLMKSCTMTRRKCNYADRKSCQKSEKENSLIIYKCHAGLVEAVMPLHESEKIIGYLMFGQITDNSNKSILYKKIEYLSEKYSLDISLLKKCIENIPFRNEEQIHAAAKIMEACTSYIIFKELITPENDKIFKAAKVYIENNLDKDININQLCNSLNIGRTKLYEIFKTELKMGISKYILRQRMHRAKKLLKTTELSIPEIAHSVGFADYNYFSRVYKKTYGKSPKYYRK